MTTLINRDFINFWIRCYLPISNNLIDRAIKRAYLDFSRTAHGIRMMESPEMYALFNDFLKELIDQVTSVNFENQEKFDLWHKDKCYRLVALFDSILTYKIHIGQVQKWINMSLKYLFALGPDRIQGISINYNYFHIPIDKIIQAKLLDKGIPILSFTWSRIDNYQDYLSYQISVRNKFVGQIPMDIEFKLFNE